MVVPHSVYRGWVTLGRPVHWGGGGVGKKIGTGGCFQPILTYTITKL